MGLTDRLRKAQEQVKEEVLEKISKILADDEKIIWVGNRQGPAFSFMNILFSLIICIAPIIFVTFLIDVTKLSKLGYSSKTLIVIFFVGSTICIILKYIYTHKKNSVYVLTTERILIRTKVLTEKIKYCFYGNISYVKYSIGLLMRGYIFATEMNLVFMTNNSFRRNLFNGSPKHFVFEDLENSEEVYNIMSKYIRKGALKGGDMLSKL